MATRPSVELYFGIDAPANWFAFVRLVEATMRTDSRLVYRPASPVEPAAVARAVTVRAAAAEYARKDQADWARFCGVRLRHTEALGRPPDAALRAVLAAIELGRPRSFVERLFAARFDDGDDVTDRAVLIALAERCGMDREALATRMESPETAAALAENDAALRRRGGFALPSMFVGDDLYVGHERLPLVEGALMCAADRPFIAPGEHGRSIDQ